MLPPGGPLCLLQGDQKVVCLSAPLAGPRAPRTANCFVCEALFTAPVGLQWAGEERSHLRSGFFLQSGINTSIRALSPPARVSAVEWGRKIATIHMLNDPPPHSGKY